MSDDNNTPEEPNTANPSATETPHVEGERPEPEPVEVVEGDRIKQYRGTEVVGEREVTPGDDATGEHPSATTYDPNARVEGAEGGEQS